MMERQIQTVAVAMSGGVDSSAVAAILAGNKAHSLFGVTARLTTEESRCCSSADLDSAKQVCAQLGMEHHEVDVRDVFQKRVMDAFGDGYLAGRTPSPCVVCNREIKFGVLVDAARELGADALATGHYARVEGGEDRPVRLCRGQDRTKDQSYFLARLTRLQLQRAVLPLGGMQKPEVVALALSRGLSCRGSKESQDICFVMEGDHGSWIDVRRFDTRGQGEILDMGGRVLGRHKGIHHYTIGQRRGLGVATGSPVYVVRIDAEQNRIVVGDKSEVMADEMTVRDVSWIRGTAPSDCFETCVQIRYQHDAAPARVVLQDNGSAEVQFHEAQFAITPGQLAAFYEGDEVLGGGWIV